MKIFHHTATFLACTELWNLTKQDLIDIIWLIAAQRGSFL